MVIKTGRRMSSLDLGNGSSDASEELAAASDSSDHTNSNNRSILDLLNAPYQRPLTLFVRIKQKHREKNNSHIQ